MTPDQSFAFACKALPYLAPLLVLLSAAPWPHARAPARGRLDLALRRGRS
jgi:hypothetical protein